MMYAKAQQRYNGIMFGRRKEQQQRAAIDSSKWRDVNIKLRKLSSSYEESYARSSDGSSCIPSAVVDDDVEANNDENDVNSGTHFL